MITFSIALILLVVGYWIYGGYVQQSIPVGNQTTFNIILKEDTETLDEVVVIGYGTA